MPLFREVDSGYSRGEAYSAIYTSLTHLAAQDQNYTTRSVAKHIELVVRRSMFSSVNLDNGGSMNECSGGNIFVTPTGNSIPTPRDQRTNHQYNRISLPTAPRETKWQVGPEFILSRRVVWIPGLFLPIAL